MRNVKFTVENGEFGVGIIPNIFKSWPNYNPTVAPGHDLIDHTTIERGTIWQEFRALGANLFVHRFHANSPGRGKMHPAKFSADFIFGGETLDNILGDQFDHFTGEAFHENNSIPETPKYHLSKTERGMFKLFWHSVRMDVEKCLEGEYIDHTTAEWFKENERGILAWFEYGFANAKRRYKGEAWQAEHCKKKINELFQKAMPTLEEREGEEFTLSYDFESGYAKIEGGRFEEVYFVV